MPPNKLIMPWGLFFTLFVFVSPEFRSIVDTVGVPEDYQLIPGFQGFFEAAPASRQHSTHANTPQKGSKKRSHYLSHTHTTGTYR
jgi:hypothetical protein